MKFLAAILIVLLAAGGIFFYLRGDPLAQVLNKSWPPVNADDQRQKAIEATAAALAALAQPNIAAGVDIKTIEETALGQVKTNGVSNVIIASDRQLLRMAVRFDRTFSAADLPPDSNKRDLVGRLLPHVTGQIHMVFTAAVTPASGPAKTLQVKLVPGGHSAHVEKVTLGGGADLVILSDAVTVLLNRYADTLTSAIVQNPIVDVALPASLQGSPDAAVAVKLPISAGPEVTFSQSGGPVKSPFRLAGAAWLIEGNTLSVIGQLADPATMAGAPAAAAATFDTIRAGFQKQLKDGLGIATPPAGIWAAIGKPLLAASLDSTFEQAAPCFTAKEPIAKETFSQKAQISDQTAIDCTPRKDCTPARICEQRVDQRDCQRPRNCPRSRDERDCAGDAACEAAKAALNDVYDRAFAGCNALGPIEDAGCDGERAAQNKLYQTAQSQCEAEKSSQKSACETEKTGLKAACETAANDLKHISRKGNLATVDGHIDGNVDMKLCFRNVRFSEKLDKVSMVLQAAGSAQLDTQLRFVAGDIAGRLTCPPDWKAGKKVMSQVAGETQSVSLPLWRQSRNGKLAYQGALGGFPVKLNFQPSPASLVRKDGGLSMACSPATGLMNAITLDLAPFVPELLKDYSFRQKAMSFDFTPDLPAPKIMGRDIKAAISETDTAIVLKGAL